MPPAFLCFYTLFLTDRKISVIYKKNDIDLYIITKSYIASVTGSLHG